MDYMPICRAYASVKIKGYFNVVIITFSKMYFLALLSYLNMQALIAELKRAGREKEIQKEITWKKAEVSIDIPKALAYVSGALFHDYIHDMKIVQRFAELNRKAMIREIVKGMKLETMEQFTTIHNYIDTDNMVLRKGASYRCSYHLE